MNSNATDEYSIFDDQANAAEVLQEKLADAEIPGAQIEFDPAEADEAGAFIEDALSEQDILEDEIDGTISATEAESENR